VLLISVQSKGSIKNVKSLL